MALLKPGLAASWSREKLCRLVFVCILASLTYGYFSHVLVHQLSAPVLKFPYLDPVFWVAHLLAIPETISSVPLLAASLDVLLFALCIAMIIYPRQRVCAAIFCPLYLLYFIIFNSYGGHHTLNKAGVLLLPLAFAVDFKRFPRVWDALRYYLLFIFLCAFVWKLMRGAWLYREQGELIVRKNLGPYLYFNPRAPLASVYHFLLRNPGLLHALFLIGFLLEGLFIVGFFTRKYDRVLFMVFLFLVAGFWFTADAFFVELLIFGLTFLPTQSRNLH